MKLILITSTLLLSVSVFSQAPQKINYQAVARNNSGNPLTNTTVTLQIEILKGSTTGVVEYSETHSKTTNDFGLFTLEIGGGSPITGTFSTITWSSNTFYLRTTINGDVMPATQLLSVPYALHAGTASTGTPGTNGKDNLSNVTVESAGQNCSDGGSKVDVGVDDNGNGTLDLSEIDHTYYICNGADGGAANISGTANNVVKFTGVNTVGNSLIYDDGSKVGVGINTVIPSMFSKFDVNGKITMRTGATVGHIPVSDAFGTMTWTKPTDIFSGSSLWVSTGTQTTLSSLTDKVGIGTTNPLLKFQINESLAIEAPNSGNSGVGHLRLSTDDSPAVLDIGIADDVYLGGWLQSHRGSDMSINYPLLLNPNGGNVGIGVTNPSDKLNINGILRIDDGSNYLRIKPSTTTIIETNTPLQIEPNGSGTVAFEIDDGDAIFHVATRVKNNFTIEGASNEIHRTETGLANLVPIAYGNIAANGTINTGTGNFLVNKSLTGQYLITVTGQTLTATNCIVNINTAASNPRFTGYGTSSGGVYVYIRNSSSTFIDNSFSFMIYKP